MALEITYAEVKFKNDVGASAANSEPTAAGKKTSIHQSKPCFPKRLLAWLLILLLLLAISFFVAFIIIFQKYSRLVKEKENPQEVLHENLICRKTNLAVAGKSWGCCPKNWIVLNTYCYLISSEMRNWTESEKNCTRMGAHLLVINTKEEQPLINKKLEQEFGYYVGLSKPEATNRWQWVDQSQYNKSVIAWHPGEPNDDPNERCVLINSRIGKWGWNNTPCHEHQKSICKMMKIYL